MAVADGQDRRHAVDEEPPRRDAHRRRSPTARTRSTSSFFKAWGHKDALVPGATALFAGTVGMYRGRWQLAHPAYQLMHGGLGDAGHRPRADPGLPPGQGHAELGRRRVRAPRPRPARRRCRTRSRPPCARGAACPGGSRRCAASTSRARCREVQRARQRMRYEEALVLQTAAGPASCAGRPCSTPRSRARPAWVGCSRRSTRGCRSS